MNQLKSIYNSPFKNLHSHTIHTCLATIASNEIQPKLTERSTPLGCARFAQISLSARYCEVCAR